MRAVEEGERRGVLRALAALAIPNGEAAAAAEPDRLVAGLLDAYPDGPARGPVARLAAHLGEAAGRLRGLGWASPSD